MVLMNQKLSGSGSSRMNLGISYTGLVYLLMLFVPNIIWTKHKPERYEEFASRENRVLLMFERTGEVLTTCAAVMFSAFNVRPEAERSGFLIASFVLMLLYEMFWIRYFRSLGRLQDFYAGFMGIPVAGATLPVFAFLLLGIYGANPVMIVSSAILGIGHIGIHLSHAREIR